VGGAITNATPHSAVGTAGYLLEYSALLPSIGVLAEQEIPHALSFRRALFEELGPYPEDTRTGEDTLFNRRCVEEGVSIGFAPGAALAHRNPTSVRAMLAHAYTHGRGLMQCVEQHNLSSIVAARDRGLVTAAFRTLVAYPARGMLAKHQRLKRHAPWLLVRFWRLSPLVALGLFATGCGALREWGRLSAENAAS
jgi:hypothetical protein